jgi:NAD(P)-dependent dehydrogenase (short-subunit alcohol dehydrogenase family)
MTSNVLEGKTCLLTAATGGLGREIALALAEQGTRLFLTSRTPTKLESLAAELQQTYGYRQGATYAAGDLASPDDVTDIITSARASMGHIDMLINCAGVFLNRSLEESTLEDFDHCFALNVRAPFLLTRAFAPDMARRGWGRIVNVGSSSAYAGFKNTALYCASKHALLGLSRSTYQELKAHNVRTFCVSPGSIKTAMGHLIKGQDYETFIDAREIAAYIVFMLSFDNEMIAEEVRLNRLFIQ